MPTPTDPARELADLCSKLRDSGNPNAQGAAVMAKAFEVEAFSAEFYQIILSIIERADLLATIFDRLDMDTDHRDELKADLNAIKQAFALDGLHAKWNVSAERYVSPARVRPIATIASQVRTLCAYPKLNDDEVAHVLQAADELLSWLDEHQLQEQDFIRQTLIDGLRAFRARLSRLGWLGWGYTVQSLEDVIAAYMALERHQPSASPDMEALYKKTTAFLKKAVGTIASAKTAVEGARFSLEVYALIAATTHGGPAAAKAALKFLGVGG